MLRSWRFALLALVIGVTLAGWSAYGGSGQSAVVQLAVFVVLAFLFSPLVFPRSVSAADAAVERANPASTGDLGANTACDCGWC